MEEWDKLVEPKSAKRSYNSFGSITTIEGGQGGSTGRKLPRGDGELFDIEALPSELIAYIFTFLPFSFIPSLSCVSRRWCSLVHESSVMREMAERQLRLRLPSIPRSDYFLLDDGEIISVAQDEKKRARKEKKRMREVKERVMSAWLSHFIKNYTKEFDERREHMAQRWWVWLISFTFQSRFLDILLWMIFVWIFLSLPYKMDRTYDYYYHTNTEGDDGRDSLFAEVMTSWWMVLFFPCCLGFFLFTVSSLLDVIATSYRYYRLWGIRYSIQEFLSNHSSHHHHKQRDQPFKYSSLFPVDPDGVMEMTKTIRSITEDSDDDDDSDSDSNDDEGGGGFFEVPGDTPQQVGMWYHVVQDRVWSSTAFTSSFWRDGAGEVVPGGRFDLDGPLQGEPLLPLYRRIIIWVVLFLWVVMLPLLMCIHMQDMPSEVGYLHIDIFIPIDMYIEGWMIVVPGMVACVLVVGEAVVGAGVYGWQRRHCISAKGPAMVLLFTFLLLVGLRVGSIIMEEDGGLWSLLALPLYPGMLFLWFSLVTFRPDSSGMALLYFIAMPSITFIVIACCLKYDDVDIASGASFYILFFLPIIAFSSCILSCVVCFLQQ